jgi:hypothetical protein
VRGESRGGHYASAGADRLLAETAAVGRLYGLRGGDLPQHSDNCRQPTAEIRPSGEGFAFGDQDRAIGAGCSSGVPAEEPAEKVCERGHDHVVSHTAAVVAAPSGGLR